MAKANDMRALTEQQAVFARAYARNGGKGAEAARDAGFSVQSAGKYAYQLLEKPHVVKAIQAEQRRSLTDLASVALGQARLMLENPATPAGARVDLIRTVLDRAGLGPPKTEEDNDDENDLNTLTLVQLEAMAVRAFAWKMSDAPTGEVGPLLEGSLAAPGIEDVPEPDRAQVGE